MKLRNVILALLLASVFITCATDPNKGEKFEPSTNDSTVNDEATLGLIGTSAESSNTGVATVEIVGGKIKITSVSEGSAVITVLDDSENEATINITVSKKGEFTIKNIEVYYVPPVPEDDNFHVYLAFGQSNMEGQNWTGSTVVYNDVIPVEYKQNVDPRFQVMAAVGGSYKLAVGTESRTKGQWYTAVPPLVKNNSGLCPADYFGRTIVAGTGDNIKVGVIVVAVGGAAIEGFEKGEGANNYFKTQPSWMQNTAALYGNNPYNHLLQLAREAQKKGVIKGIIMHQGESGAVRGTWNAKVKGIYDNMLKDLGLEPNSIPILAGQGYGSHGQVINTLPSAFSGLTLPGTSTPIAHIIPSNGCPSGGDGLHFSYQGYKTIGERYGEKMLELVYGK